MAAVAIYPAARPGDYVVGESIARAIFAKPVNLFLVVMINRGFYRFNSREYSMWPD